MARRDEQVHLDTSVGYVLKQASSALRTAMEAVLRPMGMTVTHYACLELLSQRPGLSNSELARGAFVSRQSMNVLLQALERDGVVARPVRPVAGRVLPARLTGLGRQRLEAASAAVRAVEVRMGSRLTAEQQQQLAFLLGQCVLALEEAPRPAAVGSGSAG